MGKLNNFVVCNIEETGFYADGVNKGEGPARIVDNINHARVFFYFEEAQDIIRQMNDGFCTSDPRVRKGHMKIMIVNIFINDSLFAKYDAMNEIVTMFVESVYKVDNLLNNPKKYNGTDNWPDL